MAIRHNGATARDDLLDAMRAAQQEGFTLFPIWREVLADCETPVSAFRKLARGPYTFLLESVEGGERLARYSFVGALPERVMRLRGTTAEWRWRRGPRAGEAASEACDDPLLLVQRELERDRVAPVTMPAAPGMTLPRFSGGAVGYLGYEIAAKFERVPVPERDPLGLPEAVLIFSDALLIFDHVAHRARIVAHARLDGDDLAAARADALAQIDAIEAALDSPIPPEPESSRGQRSASGGEQKKTGRLTFERHVALAKEAIAAGDAFQIVLSRRMERPTAASPLAIYRALRALNPSPYLFFLDCEDFAIAGASPEMLVRVESREVALHPIAGTRPRGATSGADASFEAELRYDPKEQAEHIMLVDLGRNDVGRVSQPGSVRVTQMMEVERYSHVMHLVSHITGALRPELSSFDAVRAAFPAGTLTGAPKVRAMEIIAQLEGERRGVYGGGIGYFGRDGNLDMAIAIRTLVIKDGVAIGQAGAGIVADSDPAAEFQETERKADALWHAVDLAEQQIAPQVKRSPKPRP
jgi:anthranilate synthase component 1